LFFTYASGGKKYGTCWVKDATSGEESQKHRISGAI
jgi:hypothetical protein